MKSQKSMKPNQTSLLGEMLPAERVWICKDIPAKRDVIERLVSVACRGEETLDPQDVLNQVLKREESLGTTLETGLSIPHARLEELARFRAALAVLPRGTRESKGGRAQAVFLLLSPARPAFFQKHLQTLAALAEKFQPEFIAELSSCSGAEQAAEKIAAR